MNDRLSGLSDREFEILNYIQKNGPTTKNNLLEKMSLKLTTLNRSMKLLEQKKLIAMSGISISTGGRKPIEYDVARSGIYTIGVDLSRTYTEIVIMNLKMKVLQKYRFTMDDSITPRKCVEEISDTIKLMLSTLSIEKEALIGIGIGTVGPINRESGKLLHPQGFLNPAWNDDIPLVEWLQVESGIPCTIDNGANTAALVESLFGIGRGHNCIVYINCGVGIRTGVVKDGLILRTMNDREDAFAHMTVNVDGISCHCGNKGCLESYASLEFISKRYKTLTGNQISYYELFTRAVNHDKITIKALNEGAAILGIGISNLAKLLNPDLVILSGPLISNYDPFYTICINAFQKWNAPDHKITFSRAGLFDEDVIAIGAGQMVIEQEFKQTWGVV